MKRAGRALVALVVALGLSVGAWTLGEHHQAGADNARTETIYMSGYSDGFAEAQLPEGS